MAADLVCSSGSVVISAPATYDSATISGTCVLIVDAPLTINGAMTIQGGNVTHSFRNLNGLRLTVGGLLQVDANGSIDVSAQGLGGGFNGSPDFAAYLSLRTL